ISGVQLQSASFVLIFPGSQQNKGSVNETSAPQSKPKKEICCVCPYTKKLRDKCIVEHGEEACAKWIEGFN
ncbi:hypothetical protein RYX36_023515, partial [Vicia faba]